MLITAVLQGAAVVVRLVASTLEPGTVTALSFALTLTNIPLGLFGYALGTALVPAFAETLLRDRARFAHLYEMSTRALFLVLAPIALLLVTLREPIVRVLFERGQFDAVASRLTSESLGIYGLSLLAQPLVVVAHRALVGAGRTRSIARVEVIGTAALIVATIGLSQLWAHRGIAAALVLATFTGAVLYTAAVGAELGVEIRGRFSRFGSTVTPIALGAALLAKLSLSLVSVGASLLGLIELAFAVLIGLSSYGLVTWYMRIPETRQLASVVVNQLRRR
jgi:putative peptidoglycan lipid II flippase